MNNIMILDRIESSTMIFIFTNFLKSCDLRKSISSHDRPVACDSFKKILISIHVT